MHGAIYQLWLAQQGEHGPAPLTDELTTPDGVGRSTHFTGDCTGWELGPLHLPTTDEMTTPDGYGRYNQFSSGCIYWTPRTGAHAPNDHAREMWSHLGWERGFLGYPQGDESAWGDGTVQQNFEHGYILWKASTRATTIYYY
jgi:uncharacterized protein with LGFP repeats